MSACGSIDNIKDWFDGSVCLVTFFYTTLELGLDHMDVTFLPCITSEDGACDFLLRLKLWDVYLLFAMETEMYNLSMHETFLVFSQEYIKRGSHKVYLNFQGGMQTLTLL